MENKKEKPIKRVAIFGATGYVGLILVNRLIHTQYCLKLFVRNKRRLGHLKQYDNVHNCDIPLKNDNIEKISQELKDCQVVIYLIHSMSQTSQEFSKLDETLASIVSKSANKADVKQIIYLGGLGVTDDSEYSLSNHLSSRHNVGNTLRRYHPNITEIRAGIIIGAGSASYEIIKALGNKMIFLPKLNYSTGVCQPIDIDDAVYYIAHSILNEDYYYQIVEIGMDEILTYDDMILEYAKIILNKKIFYIKIPFLEKIVNKNTVAKIIAFYSAIPYSLSKPLVDGLNSKAIISQYPVTLIDKDPINYLGYKDALFKANSSEKSCNVESFWSIPVELQVLSKEKEKFLYIDANEERANLLFEHRMRTIEEKDANAIFNECLKIGGSYGYWSPRWMWNLRALLDKVIGGTGLDSGRQTNQNQIRVGERIDFWIVSDFLNEKDIKILTLKARLKSPGNSWLQFAVIKDKDNQWKFLLRAYFEPDGIKGYLYWYSLWGIHKYIFTAMIDNIIFKATKN